MSSVPIAAEVSLRGISRINLANLLSSVIYLLIVAVPVFFFVYVKTTGYYSPCYPLAVAECTGEALSAHKYFATANWLALFSAAAVSGALGTVISFFLRLTRSDPISLEYRDEAPLRYVVGLREIVILCYFGSVFGLLLLTLFVGGFIQGELFPTISSNSWIEIDVRIKTWAKISIWCFLAGFSERLVPSLLDSLAKRMEVKPVEPKDRLTVRTLHDPSGPVAGPPLSVEPRKGSSP